MKQQLPGDHRLQLMICVSAFCLSFMIAAPSISIAQGGKWEQPPNTSGHKPSAATPKASQTAITPKESIDIARKVTFTNSGGIKLTKRDDLSFGRSRGWTIGNLDEVFDIGQYPLLRIEYSTGAECTIYLELKNRSDEAVIGNETNNNMQKYRLTFTPQQSSNSPILIDLSGDIRKNITDTAVSLVAFSDPTCDITIRSMKFLKKVK